MSAHGTESGNQPADRSPIVVRRFSELTASQLHDILELRSKVFVVEQECLYNDIDGRDVEDSTRHVWVEEDGTIAAYLRVLDATGRADHHVRIGRVVTDPAHRGRGLAAQLVELMIERHGAIVLDAQAHLHDWYEQLGFEQSGEEYVEDGIPHIPMRRSHPVE